jgi:hypothetical protein
MSKKQIVTNLITISVIFFISLTYYVVRMESIEIRTEELHYSFEGSGLVIHVQVPPDAVYTKTSDTYRAAYRAALEFTDGLASDKRFNDQYNLEELALCGAPRTEGAFFLAYLLKPILQPLGVDYGDYPEVVSFYAWGKK